MNKVPRSAKNKALIIILSAVFVLAAAVIIFRVAQSSQARGEFEDLSDMTQQTPAGTAPADGEKAVLPQYAELFSENPDLAGWISIEGTVVDYPVMYTPDEPQKYLRLSFYGESSTAGAPFIDARCALEPESTNLIIYGHNMKDGTMFHTIMSYKDKAFFEEHPVICFNTLYEEREYEVFAVFYSEVFRKSDTCYKFYNFIDAEDEAVFNENIENLRAMSLYDTGVEAEFGDSFIMLVTCSYHTENGRFAVLAKLKSS